MSRRQGQILECARHGTMAAGHAGRIRAGEFNGRGVVGRRGRAPPGDPQKASGSEAEAGVRTQAGKRHALRRSAGARKGSKASRGRIPNTGNPKADKKYEKEQQKLVDKENKEHQKLEQQQQKEDDTGAKAKLESEANPADGAETPTADAANGTKGAALGDEPAASASGASSRSPGWLEGHLNKFRSPHLRVEESQLPGNGFVGRRSLRVLDLRGRDF